MEQKHTPEPWSIDDGDSELVGIFADDLDAIAYACEPLFPNQGKPLRGYEVDRANLQRAAVCVNALAGIDDPAALLRDVRAVLTDARPYVTQKLCDGVPEETFASHEAHLKSIDALLSRLPEPTT